MYIFIFIHTFVYICVYVCLYVVVHHPPSCVHAAKYFAKAPEGLGCRALCLHKYACVCRCVCVCLCVHAETHLRDVGLSLYMSV